ncbi:ABC transporter permease [Streptomyces sp. NPDC048257]|uniref:ABC transporter permease n=1 Tax=Streptomyces sp. NPDC048257 TaxID=3365526 RepID=UPI003722496A
MSTLRVWARDLSIGARFAFGGGREGWTRTLLTGIGVGLGVALLLITTALPSALTARYERGDARSRISAPTADAPGPGTLLITGASQTYRDHDIEGQFLQAEGPGAPLPPGLRKIPGPGEVAVSPALRELLDSPDGRLLRERLDAKVTEVIGDAGLIGPGELLYYAGTDRLQKAGPQDYRVQRITGFANATEPEELDPVLRLLVVLTFVALLLPVAVFIAAAVRFGGERRDRRLAALRLVGADVPTVRRIAGGEALAGSLVGLVLGAGFFAFGRGLVGSFTLQQRSVFPADLDPSVWLAGLVALVVPAAAVAVTQFALRGVVIEPLGVVRTATPRRRRIWWRLLLPLAGLGLLAPMAGRGDDGGDFNQTQVSAGVVLLLVGITALLPWLLEQLVGRTSGGGPVSWQLATRRLQLGSGAAARLVNGIAVAVAGAIALQMLFAAVQEDYTDITGQDPSRAAFSVMLPRGGEGRAEVAAKLSATEGVARAVALTSVQADHRPDTGNKVEVTIGTCDALREVAVLDSCADGDAFLLTGTSNQNSGVYGSPAKPGETMAFTSFIGPFSGPDEKEKTVEWTFPAAARTVASRVDPAGTLRDGILLTPSIAPAEAGHAGNTRVFVQLDPTVPDALELARTAALKADPINHVLMMESTREDAGYSAIRTGLFFGSTAVLILIGTSLLVSQLEQLRERRKLLSSLVAFGTKRSTLCLSVLWQTALPIVLGLGLAVAAGLGLGAVLMRMAGRIVRIDWAPVATMAGVGAGLVAVMTLLSLPPLLRLMRPDGLRTE